MAQRSLRFGIHEGPLRAATWKIWTETAKGKADVYLACRSLGGSLKASLHQSRQWHIAYSQTTFEEQVQGAIPKFEDRFIEKWPRPPEIAPGVTLAFRIVTPCTATTNPLDGGNHHRVVWLPNAQAGRAREIDVLLVQPTTPISGWPGKRSMKTELVGSFSLESGESVWVVHWVVDMPDFGFRSRLAHFYKGMGKEDLSRERLRAMVFGTEPDGSRVIYDCAVENTTALEQRFPF